MALLTGLVPLCAFLLPVVSRLLRLLVTPSLPARLVPAPHRRAIDLARREYPAVVIEVEEEWGDWLMTQKQMDAAINHFIEAGRYALCCREKAGGRMSRALVSGAECGIK